ncbi:MAG: ribonuclease D [Thermoanaerobaculia bacterium]|nr:ribonuclease D [Thermoanaerobaculia bacterium]
MSVRSSQALGPGLSTPPDTVPYRWIGSGADLAENCARWRQHEAVALDTEFVRERSFYPALGLVQIATPDEIALIDPKVLADPQPLVDLLLDSRVVKVLHAGSEDLEAFRHTWDVLPDPLVDTQIAAAMAGLDWSMGYSRLVAQVCGVSLPKGHTRTDWLKRPLSEAQKRYAALDVLYLLPVWSHLRSRLETLGRVHWLQQDCTDLLASARQDLDPEDAYLQIGRAKVLDRRRLAVLRALARWREQQSRQRDLPRNFVLREQSVAEIAQNLPATLSQLRRVKGVGPQEVRRDGETILELVRSARALPAEDLPDRIGRPLDLAPHAATVKALRLRVNEISSDLGVPSVLLSNKRTIEALTRRFLTRSRPLLPATLRGWREDVVAADLVATLEAEFETRIDG